MQVYVRFGKSRQITLIRINPLFPSKRGQLKRVIVLGAICKAHGIDIRGGTHEYGRIRMGTSGTSAKLTLIAESFLSWCGSAKNDLMSSWSIMLRDRPR